MEELAVPYILRLVTRKVILKYIKIFNSINAI